MSNSKYSNDPTAASVTAFVLVESLAYIPRNKGDVTATFDTAELTKELIDLLEQTRTNTIKACIEAKPKEVGHAEDCPRLMDGVCDCGAAEFNTALDQWESNLKALIGGDAQTIPADGICHQHLIMGCTLNHTNAEGGTK